MNKFFKRTLKREDFDIIDNKLLKDINNILEFLNKLKIIDLLNNSDIGKFKYINEGRSGIVYRFKNYCIKIFKKDLKSSSLKYWYMENDANILNDLKGIDIYPNLYGYIDKTIVIMEYIEGTTLENFKIHIDNLNENIIENLLNSMYDTLKKGIFPMDIHHSNIIIDKKGGIHCIDVGCFKHKSTNEIEKYINKFNLFEETINILLIELRGLLKIQEMNNKLIA